MNEDLFTDEPAPKTDSLFTDEPKPETGMFGQTLGPDTTSQHGWDIQQGKPMALAPESEVRNEPGLQDVSVPDFMAGQGAYGLGKLGIAGAGKVAGSVLSDVLPAASKIPYVGALIPNTENVIPAIGETADSMLMKSLGTSPGQIKALMGHRPLEEGVGAVEDAAQVARKAGLGDIFSTGRGRRQALADFTKQEGQKIGALRSEAGSPALGMLEQVEADVSKKYNPSSKDVFSGELPDVGIAKNTVQNIAGENPTHASIAEGITGLNKYAAGNRVNLPKNALTDFAGKASGANDAGIVQSLGADKGQAYLDALHDESGAFHLQPAQARGFQREAGGRGSPKTGFMSALQKMADSGGYRLTSKAANAIHEILSGEGALQAAPGVAAKTQGQMLPAALSDFLSKKYGNR